MKLLGKFPFQNDVSDAIFGTMDYSLAHTYFIHITIIILSISIYVASGHLRKVSLSTQLLMAYNVTYRPSIYI